MNQHDSGSVFGQISLSGTWVIDLDGVIWLTHEPISGSAAAISKLREAGGRALFATNNAEPTRADLLSRLSRAGIDTQSEDLITSAEAAAQLVVPGSRVLACGGPGVLEALENRDAIVGSGPPYDAVVVGLSTDFDYEMMTTAALAVRAGARLIGTNNDPTHPTPDGLFPGSGAILASVAVASETEPEVAGKPYDPMVELVRSRSSELSLMVGDRPATDGRLAQRLGLPFALVQSGVTAPPDGRGDGPGDGRGDGRGDGPGAVPTAVVAADLLRLVEIASGL